MNKGIRSVFCQEILFIRSRSHIRMGNDSDIAQEFSGACVNLEDGTPSHVHNVSEFLYFE